MMDRKTLETHFNGIYNNIIYRITFSIFLENTKTFQIKKIILKIIKPMTEK